MPNDRAAAGGKFLDAGGGMILIQPSTASTALASSDSKAPLRDTVDAVVLTSPPPRDTCCAPEAAGIWVCGGGLRLPLSLGLLGVETS